MARYRRLKYAIKDKTLKLHARGDAPKNNEVTRDALIEYANNIGERPPFLFPGERKKRR